MNNYSLFVTVAADIVVAALVTAIVVCLGLLLWITWRLTARAASRIRPARPGARPGRGSAPVRIVAELGPDGRDSGRTTLERSHPQSGT